MSSNTGAWKTTPDSGTVQDKPRDQRSDVLTEKPKRYRKSRTHSSSHDKTQSDLDDSSLSNNPDKDAALWAQAQKPYRRGISEVQYGYNSMGPTSIYPQHVQHVDTSCSLEHHFTTEIDGVVQPEEPEQGPEPFIDSPLEPELQEPQAVEHPKSKPRRRSSRRPGAPVPELEAPQEMPQEEEVKPADHPKEKRYRKQRRSQREEVEPPVDDYQEISPTSQAQVTHKSSRSQGKQREGFEHTPSSQNQELVPSMTSRSHREHRPSSSHELDPRGSSQPHRSYDTMSQEIVPRRYNSRHQNPRNNSQAWIHQPPGSSKWTNVTETRQSMQVKKYDERHTQVNHNYYVQAPAPAPVQPPPIIINVTVKRPVLNIHVKNEIRERQTQKALRQMGECPIGFKWLKEPGGWRCSAGNHYVSDLQVEDWYANPFSNISDFNRGRPSYWN